MRTIPITDFKARCLALLQELHDTDERLIVTKHGKPFAEVRPCKEELEAVLARFRGSVVDSGDVVDPVGEEWDVER